MDGWEFPGLFPLQSVGHVLLQNSYKSPRLLLAITEPSALSDVLLKLLLLYNL